MKTDERHKSIFIVIDKHFRIENLIAGERRYKHHIVLLAELPSSFTHISFAASFDTQGFSIPVAITILLCTSYLSFQYHLLDDCARRLMTIFAQGNRVSCLTD